jgi:hypothetical protein
VAGLPEISSISFIFNGYSEGAVWKTELVLQLVRKDDE